MTLLRTRRQSQEFLRQSIPNLSLLFSLAVIPKPRRRFVQVEQVGGSILRLDTPTLELKVLGTDVLEDEGLLGVIDREAMSGHTNDSRAIHCDLEVDGNELMVGRRTWFYV